MTNSTWTRIALWGGIGVLSAACAGNNPETTPKPKADSVAHGPTVVHDTVVVKDPQAEDRADRFELKLLEREAQVDQLQTRLDEARQEVVRAMAKLQTMATRAEAASGMAEAEVAAQSLKSTTGKPSPEYTQATQLLQQGSVEFNKQNYGGALYLANQVKQLAGRDRATPGDTGPQRKGEVAFVVPIKLQTSGKSNIRDGPGTNFRVLFTLESGADVTGYSYLETWVKVSDAKGRSGWVARGLVGRGKDN